ncbi:sulfate ABC transporter ATPase [Knoellia subterranea KCTC 19937]|uniref:Sulfate ABC transporter ATPase n=1 Tax=Knoellia subterranea KCTC 19937 TaxID=1385521 RepID=A0A0A0JKR4_9MICO|nr:sulfate ABC transporter ATPase [Knoellia subterranea KCTC 19937]
MSVTGLRKAYGTTVAVADVGFDVRAGEIFGILGPNGAGKTTTVESIAGLRTPDAGTIRVHGLDPVRDRAELTRLVGVQLQESKLQPKITVAEALELWSAFYADPIPSGELASRLGLADLLQQQFRTLSGGQQQRLSIALALVGRPKVVILDELTTGLDPRARREVWGLVRDVRDTGVTVLLVTHSMEEAQALCDRVAIISGGRVRALDTPDGLVSRAASATVTSFRASTTVDLEALRKIDGVASVRTDSGVITVEGAEDSALEVLSSLAAQGVSPSKLRVVEGSLDTAYLDLTADHVLETT